jgi:hypothetical protein
MALDRSIQVDPARGLIVLTLGGFATIDETQAFAREMAAAVATLGGTPNQHLTLCDISDLKIQSQETIQSFGALLAGKRYQSRKLAFVLGDSLARMQVRRLITSRVAECFADRAAAERWLFAADADSVAA